MIELPQRTTAVNVLDRMSDIFLDLIRYEEPQNEDSKIELHLYWFCVTNFVHSVLSGGIVPFDFH